MVFDFHSFGIIILKDMERRRVHLLADQDGRQDYHVDFLDFCQEIDRATCIRESIQITKRNFQEVKGLVDASYHDKTVWGGVYKFVQKVLPVYYYSFIE